jgi:hypothetical protein
MALPSKSPPPGIGAVASVAPSKKKARAHHAIASPAGGAGLDDYFKEGEQKSKEEDFAPTNKIAVPPPPKMGGPPRGPPKSASGTPVPPETEDVARADAEPEV